VSLLDAVAARLDAEQIPVALVGASALAAHGVSRSTFDHDLLTADRAVLEPAFWSDLRPGVSVDSRAGDSDDPIDGIVRFQREGDRDVDLLVIRRTWARDAVVRAERPPTSTLPVAIVQAADLVLLKLYAGGAQDRWDIEQLLALDVDAAWRATVDARVAALPSRCVALWAELRD